MTRDDIIAMARKCYLPETEIEGVFRVNSDDLGRMLAEEREVCARLAEQYCRYNEWQLIVAAIRARGEK